MKDKHKTNSDDAINIHRDKNRNIKSMGLTKREYFAALILQGLSSWNPNEKRMLCDYINIADEAVARADKLIKKLNESAQ